MRILLDTHVLLWIFGKPEKLSETVRRAIEDPANEVMFSAVSIWEIAIKAALRRSDFVADSSEVLAEAQDNGLVELPLRAAVATRVAFLPHHHADPFDRLLVAQAMSEPAEFYTADAQLEAYSPLVRRV